MAKEWHSPTGSHTQQVRSSLDALIYGHGQPRFTAYCTLRQARSWPPRRSENVWIPVKNPRRNWNEPTVGDADLVIRHSAVNLAGFLEDSEGEDGRKSVEVSERDRAEVFCGTCGNDAGMTSCLETPQCAILILGCAPLSHACSRGG